ncbi:MAG: CBS domain-containing protein [Nitrospira sp.]|nr:MAG: CBS domain-containing protein [Nitrospira sp.]
MKARDIMTTDVITLPPDCLIGDLVRKLAEMKLQAFPVVDANGNLLGIVNIWRLLRHVLPPYIVSGDLVDVRFAPDLNQLHERLASMRNQPVSAIMNRKPPTVRPDHSVLECAALMLNTPKTVYLLPVVDESGRFLGIIAPLDLIKEIA